MKFKSIFQNYDTKVQTNVPYIGLFRFANKKERAVIVTAILCSMLASVYLPYAVIIYGEFVTLLVDRKLGVRSSSRTLVVRFFGGDRLLEKPTEEQTKDAILEDTQAFGLASLAGCIVILVFAILGVDLLNLMSLNQIKRIRISFLKSMLRQDMSWYDTNKTDNFAVRVTEDLDKVKEGIGEKLAITIIFLMAFLLAIVFAFFYGWKLTLSVLSCVPLLILASALVTQAQTILTEKEQKSYSASGSIAEETLSSIKTVVAFGGEEKELERYKQNLLKVEKDGIRKGLVAGIGNGITWFIVYCIYTIAFWYGINLILDDREKVEKTYTPAVLIIVLFGILGGAQNLGLITSHLEAMATAKVSALSVFNVIDRKPKIDPFSTEGLRPTNIEGNIKFSYVTFRYPARHDVQILNGLNLDIEAGQKVALVGPSGCGKSTILQLLQRLYDPDSGTIEIDGTKICELNIQWLRSLIGVVGQEPVLFATTIRENIRYGNPKCSDEDIERAARIANCHGFITRLPNGYETLIGERGAQVSGGQKQRIAIARAIVRDPKILILDEATSALDSSSEKRVQNALEEASKGRTTLVVSHRLSTVFKSDKIVFINNGIVYEEGTHPELMEKQGLYYDLVQANNEKPVDTRISARKLSSRSKILSYDSDYSSEDELEFEQQNKFHVIDDDFNHKKASSFRLMKLNAPEWPYIISGCLAAIIIGGSFPSFAYLFGEMVGYLSLRDANEIRRRVKKYSPLFLLIGTVSGLAHFLETFMFSFAGVRLTSRLRGMSFQAMMNQEMGWFDDKKNAVGSLCSRLSSDCASVQGATGSRIGSFLQAGSVIIIGVAVSATFSIKMTAMASLAIPLVLFFVFMDSRFSRKGAIKEKEAMETASQIAVEAITNIKTVASLCQEPHILERYIAEIEKVDKYCRSKSRLRGLVFGLGQAVPLMSYGISLCYGGFLVAHKQIEYKNILKTSEALIFGSWMLGQTIAYSPNITEAIFAASRLLKLFDRKPKVTSPASMPLLQTGRFESNIDYKDISFRYPTRPNVPILDDFNLQVLDGQTIGLVGGSGCGKSTCVQILLRYYDALGGKIFVNDLATIDYPIKVLRSKLGLVSQEPVLFDKTIAENIAYGDNSKSIPMSEIIEAAKAANIHEFIAKLPQGYDTGLGSHGTQLSGGQKQRIAIARALVRNPKILLLDEATSALDTHSENIVQAALDEARTGRTCIIIAHRLTTLQNADLIFVIEDGEVVEKGTHNELMRLGQKYAKLYAMQQVK